MTETGRRRPISLTVVGWLFIAVGLGTIVKGLWSRASTSLPPELASKHAMDGVYAAASGVVAALGGRLVLRGRSVGRWLIAAWLVAHVWLSWLHEPLELTIHAVICVVGLWLLFRPAASAFFRGPAPPGALPPGPVTDVHAT